VSTILDALRKLQRERSAANPARDLRGSVTDEIPLPPPRGGRPRRGWATGALTIGLLAVAGLGGAWLYQKGVFKRAPAQRAAPPQGELGPGPGAPPPAARVPRPTVGEGQAGGSDAERGASEEELAAVEREMDAATAPDAETPPAAAPAAPPAQPPISAADEAVAERLRLEEVRRAAEAADQSHRDAEAQAAADAAAAAVQPLPPAPPPATAPPPPPAAKSAPAAKPSPAQTATASAAAPKATSKPKAKPVSPPPESERRARAPEPEPDDASTAPVPFPDVKVESIRWHPLAERRAASLRFEQQNARDAHEGDIVGGVLVYRIEPGAVELRVGSTTRVVRPTP